MQFFRHDGFELAYIDQRPAQGTAEPVLLIHGDRDELIPPQALFQASQGLSALEVPVEWHISPGIGHGIDGEGLRHGGEFLARRFKSLKK